VRTLTNVADRAHGGSPGPVQASYRQNTTPFPRFTTGFSQSPENGENGFGRKYSGPMHRYMEREGRRKILRFVAPVVPHCLVSPRRPLTPGLDPEKNNEINM